MSACFLGGFVSVKWRMHFVGVWFLLGLMHGGYSFSKFSWYSIGWVLIRVWIMKIAMGQYTWCCHSFVGSRFVFHFKKVATMVSFLLLLFIRLANGGSFIIYHSFVGSRYWLYDVFELYRAMHLLVHSLMKRIHSSSCRVQ